MLFIMPCYNNLLVRLVEGCAYRLFIFLDAIMI